MKVSKIKRLVKDCFDVGITDPSNIYKVILEENPESSSDEKMLVRIINCSKILNEKIDKKKKNEEKELYGDENETLTSFIELDDYEIYEQIVGNKYIDMKGETYDTITYGETIYIPLDGEEIEKNKEVVLLPTGILDYGEITELINEIKKFIYTYYDCSEDVLTYSAWYILLTWVYDQLNTINYLRGLGDYGTGKSRWMDTVGRICYKPIIGSGAGSMAALKRMVKKWKGTVLTDEGDFRDDDEKNDLIKFYNLGFEKNRKLYQCNKLDPNKIDFFDPYCPKIITTRKQFKDQALESRCLTHITKTTTRKDVPIILSNEFYLKQEELRNKLLKFRFDYFYKIDVDKILEINLGENLEPRIKQMAISFASLFANIPNVFDEFKEFLQKYQKDIIKSRSDSFDGMIINVIYKMIEEENKYITSGKIVKYITNKNPKFEIRSSTVGKHLKSLGIETKDKRFDGKRGNVIMFNDTLINVFKKYVSDIDKEFLESVERMESGDGGQGGFKKFFSKGDNGNNSNNNKKKSLIPHPDSQPSPPSPPKDFLKKMKRLQEYLNPIPFTDLLKSFNGTVTKEELTNFLDFLKSDGTIIELKPKMYQVI